MNNLNINGWIIEQDLSSMDYYNESETIFAQGNGYFGMRGGIEEGYKGEVEGTFVNAFYDTEEIVYGEVAYGYAKNRQTQLLVPNTKNLVLEIDGEIFSVEESDFKNHKRVLNLKNGEIIRSFTWITKTKKQVEIKISRLISMEIENLMVLKLDIRAINFSGSIKIKSGIKKDKTSDIDEADPRVSGMLKYSLETYNKFSECGCLIQKSKTRNSKLGLITAIKNYSDKEIIENEVKQLQNSIIEEITLNLKEKEEITFTKYAFYYFNKIENIEIEVDDKINYFNDLCEKSYDYYRNLQNDYYKKFWDKSDIEIKGDDETQAAIRFNIFHLIQSVGKNGKTNIAAKGLTGDGYEGHYFWDTETYVIPHFTYTNPEIAKQLLTYRYSILPKAKDRAKEMSFKGALYPWRTINGEESSAYYPAGTAQIHINSDIMYSLRKYYEATDDMEFMLEKGLEMLVETSRFYADYSDYIEGRGYCFNGVTGPDEYNALVNNNTYTNMMIRYQIQFLLSFLEHLKTNHTEEYKQSMEKLAITRDELKLFLDIINNTYIHYDEERGLIGQDDSFLNKKTWDFENTSKDKYPLLLHYHPMVIYKHQVIKQADLILAMLLMPENFTEEEIKANFDYYEGVTTHDSSLSECIHSIIAHKLGYNEMSYKFFENTVKTDLYDLHHNVKNGVHIAAMAGSWQCIVFGFMGMRQINEVLNFKPSLPKEFDEISAKITYKGRTIKVTLNKEGASYKLLEGDSIEIISNGNTVLLENESVFA